MQKKSTSTVVFAYTWKRILIILLRQLKNDQFLTVPRSRIFWSNKEDIDFSCFIIWKRIYINITRINNAKMMLILIFCRFKLSWWINKRYRLLKFLMRSLWQYFTVRLATTLQPYRSFFQDLKTLFFRAFKLIWIETFYYPIFQWAGAFLLIITRII